MATFLFPNSQDPSDTLDYRIDLTAAIGSDTIASVDFAVIGITVSSFSIVTGGRAIALRLSSGTPGFASVKFTATLTSGQVIQRTAKILIEQR